MDFKRTESLSEERRHFHECLHAIFGAQAQESLVHLWQSAPRLGPSELTLDVSPRFMLVRDERGNWPCPFCGQAFAGRNPNLLKHIRWCEAADAHPWHRIRFNDRLWWLCFGLKPPLRYWIEFTDTTEQAGRAQPTGLIDPDRYRVQIPGHLHEIDRRSVATAAQQELRRWPRDCTVEVVWPTGRPLNPLC